MQIEYNGITYNIPREQYESNEIYHQRAWFIVKCFPKNKQELDEITHLSVLWKNIKFLDCKYNDNIHKKIKDLELNIKQF